MKVKDAMHKGVDWVGPDTPVNELAKLMRDHDVGARRPGIAAPVGTVCSKADMIGGPHLKTFADFYDKSERTCIVRSHWPQSHIGARVADIWGMPR